MLIVPCPVGEKKESMKTPRFRAEHLKERCRLLRERRGTQTLVPVCLFSCSRDAGRTLCSDAIRSETRRGC